MAQPSMLNNVAVPSGLGRGLGPPVCVARIGRTASRKSFAACADRSRMSAFSASIRLWITERSPRAGHPELVSSWAISLTPVCLPTLHFHAELLHELSQHHRGIGNSALLHRQLAPEIASADFHQRLHSNREIHVFGHYVHLGPITPN